VACAAAVAAAPATALAVAVAGVIVWLSLGDEMTVVTRTAVFAKTV